MPQLLAKTNQPKVIKKLFSFLLQNFTECTIEITNAGMCIGGAEIIGEECMTACGITLPAAGFFEYKLDDEHDKILVGVNLTQITTILKNAQHFNELHFIIDDAQIKNGVAVQMGLLFYDVGFNKKLEYNINMIPPCEPLDFSMSGIVYPCNFEMDLASFINDIKNMLLSSKYIVLSISGGKLCFACADRNANNLSLEHKIDYVETIPPLQYKWASLYALTKLNRISGNKLKISMSDRLPTMISQELKNVGTITILFKGKRLAQQVAHEK